MAEEAGTALEPRSRAQLELIHKAILGEAELPAADPAAMSRQIMERILAAESFEDAFTQQNLTPWRSMLGVPVVVRDVHFNRSTVATDGGPSVYAVVDVQPIDTKSGELAGEPVSVTCGGANVLAQLVKGLEQGWLLEEKRPVRMIENATAQGYGALWLEAA